jgi:hypothetical protein
MRGYADTKQSNAGHRNGEHAPHHGDSEARRALGDPRNESPRSQSLLQMGQALEQSPRVQSQLALQRALNRPRPEQEQSSAAEAPPQREFAPLQTKANATGPPLGEAGATSGLGVHAGHRHPRRTGARATPAA